MIAYLQAFIYSLLFLVVLVMSGFALIDASLRPAPAFVAAEKRTKRFWLVVLAVATALAFVALPGALGPGFLLLALLAAVAAGVYLADVRPKVARHSGGRGRGRRRGGW